ncbi:MAG TPA: long-chain fatty acid--CoA ligase [Stellaceae bacterium]|jgi:long-chain acyl-CoA synthetase
MAIQDTEQAAWPWLKSYPAGIDWHTDYPGRPIHELMLNAASAHGDKPCLDFMGRGWSYREVGDLVRRAATGLAAHGVTKGTRVALLLPNSPTYVVCYFAVTMIGGTVVNLNPLYTAGEIRHLVEDSGAEVLVTLDVKQLYVLAAPLLGTTSLRKIVVQRMADILPPVKSVLYPVFKRGDIAPWPRDARHADFRDLVANSGNVAPASIDPERDVAVLQYTGGTTGVPKGAMLTHRNLWANTQQCLTWLQQMPGAIQRVLCVLPFFHVFAMTGAMNIGLACGAELLLMPRFTIDDLFALIKRKRPTYLPGVPTLYTAIYNHPKAKSVDLSSIRICVSGGASLPLEVKTKFEAATGCKLMEGYGLSETSPVLTINPLDAARSGSAGLPVPGTIIEIASTEDSLKLLAQGERGEICARGPQVMPGYWHKPDETAHAMAGGRFHTGDVGYLDADGYLFIVDRIKDVIIASGYKIYPRLVEEALYQHPKVAQAIVIGVPDPYRGQTVKAVVQPRAGETIAEDELRDFLKDKVSAIERPHFIEFRASLPMTPIGKPDKKALLAEEAGKAKTS